MPEPKPIILLIHGLGLKESETSEFGKWKDALSRSLGDDAQFLTAELRMAYYSDELHPEVRVAGRRGSSGRRGSDDRLSASTKAQVEEQVVDLLEQRFWEYLAEQEGTAAAAAGAPVRRRGGAGRREVTRLPDVEIGPGQTYRAFVRDLIKYFGLGHREPVNAKLAALLEASADRPTLLISHSLGTIVSYDVLSTGQYRVETWLTLGSPLGYTQDLQHRLRHWLKDLSPEQCVALANTGGQIEETVAWLQSTVEGARAQINGFLSVFRRAVPGRREVYQLPPPQYPDGKVDHWHNLYDPTDPVAAPPGLGDPTLADEYLSDGRERVHDITITNLGGHPHSEVGYLEAPQTVRLVRDFLLRHPTT